jgi:hypothetical protein
MRSKRVADRKFLRGEYFAGHPRHYESSKHLIHYQQKAVIDQQTQQLLR